MCTYALARFSCRHEIWGRRTKLCTIGEDFARNEIEADCAFRGTHPMKTMLNSQPCYKCMQTKALPMLCRAKLQEARSAFKERWPEAATEEGNDAPESLKAVETNGPKSTKIEDPSTQMLVKSNVSSTAQPSNVVVKTCKPAGIPKPNAGAATSEVSLPSGSKKTPLSLKNAPAQKTTPSRLSRLAMPTRKTPEKTITSSKTEAKTAPPKGVSRLPKPGFLR